MKRLLFLFSIIISVTTAIHGQEIKGRVISNDGTPVADANVVLQNSTSEYMGIESTDAEGSFTFQYKADTFRLVVHHLAFHSREIMCTAKDVGDILLEPSDVALGDVVISRERPLVKVEEGKLAYDLGQLTRDKVVNNTYEALTKLPGGGMMGVVIK